MLRLPGRFGGNRVRLGSNQPFENCLEWLMRQTNGVLTGRAGPRRWDKINRNLDMKIISEETLHSQQIRQQTPSIDLLVRLLGILCHVRFRSPLLTISCALVSEHFWRKCAVSRPAGDSSLPIAQLSLRAPTVSGQLRLRNCRTPIHPGPLGLTRSLQIKVFFWPIMMQCGWAVDWSGVWPLVVDQSAAVRCAGGLRAVPPMSGVAQCVRCLVFCPTEHWCGRVFQHDSPHRGTEWGSTPPTAQAGPGSSQRFTATPSSTACSH